MSLTKNISYLVWTGFAKCNAKLSKKAEKEVMIVSLPNNELGLLTKLRKKASAPVYRFLLRKMSMLTCSGVRGDRTLVTSVQPQKTPALRGPTLL